MRLLTAVAFALMICGCTTGAVVRDGALYSHAIGPAGTAARGAFPPFPHESGPVTSLFGLVAWGDASIATARQTVPRQGRISHVDYRRECVLGICRFWARTFGTSP